MLPDYLKEDLRVVFCGTAAGRKSGELGHYYAGRGNKFWKVLFEAGFVPRLLSPLEDSQVLNFGIGLTDLAKGVSGMDGELPRGSLLPERLADVVGVWTPRCIAFNGKKAATTCFGKKRVSRYGRHDFPDYPPIWVLPSTSGAANAYWSIEPWRKLAKEVGQLPR